MTYVYTYYDSQTYKTFFQYEVHKLHIYRIQFFAINAIMLFLLTKNNLVS